LLHGAAESHFVSPADFNEEMLPENARLKGYSGYDLSTIDQQPMVYNPTNYPPPPSNTFGHTMKHGIPKILGKGKKRTKLEESPNNGNDLPSTLNGFTTLQAGGFHGSQSQMSHLLMMQPDEEEDEDDGMRNVMPSGLRGGGSIMEETPNDQEDG
jgi:hypothetical protein